MEKNQNVQQPSQVKETTSQPNSKSPQTSSRNVFLYLLSRQPWVLLIGLSIIFVLFAALSLHSLSSVEFIEPTQPEAQDSFVTGTEQPTETDSETANPTDTDNPTENTHPISLWMVATIALSCASGCLIIFRLLNRPAQSQKVHKPKNRYQARQAKRQKTESRPPKNSAMVLQPQSKTSMMDHRA